MRRRLLANLVTTHWALRRAFNPAVLSSIEQAVARSERSHSGELRFAIEAALDVPSLLRGITARDRAIDAFARLRTWDTRANNGVLIYVLLAEHDIEIVADRGFEGKVSAAQWQQVCEQMERQFRNGEFEAGALQGIQMVNDLICGHFPPESNDVDELPNRPVIL